MVIIRFGRAISSSTATGLSQTLSSTGLVLVVSLGPLHGGYLKSGLSPVVSGGLISKGLVDSLLWRRRLGSTAVDMRFEGCVPVRSCVLADDTWKPPVYGRRKPPELISDGLVDMKRPGPASG